jgi:hypothetical protein
MEKTKNIVKGLKTVTDFISALRTPLLSSTVTKLFSDANTLYLFDALMFRYPMFG